MIDPPPKTSYLLNVYVYLQVVDFCCGANDFSILMKEKLDSAGKKCNFKNFDIIQPKVRSEKLTCLLQLSF